MKYEAVIGIETHVQMKTRSKMFCSCPNEYGREPNTLTCPVCLGYPGTLPVPNKEAVRLAIRAGLLTGCRIARRSKFDRKSYFYPDLAKNYQISQFDLPFCEAGHISIGGKGFSGEPLPAKEIGLTRIHLEEDPAKLTHHGGSSGIDYNRSGVPLIEIVSEPDMRTADEAYAYLTTLKEIMRFGGIGDCDMEKGQMRCDVNISLRPVGQKEFGVKIELKNLNSFRAAHRAVEYEIWRQSGILDAGGVIEQETRGWNDDAGESYLMRKKEQAHDYRYFPDPDLMPFEISDAEIDEIKAALPELPEARRRRFVEQYSIAEYDAVVMTQDTVTADYFETAAKLAKTPKLVANWISSELLRVVAERKTDLASCGIAPEAIAKLTDMISSGDISGKIGKQVFEEMVSSGKDPEAVVKEKGLSQVSDSSEITGIVAQALEQNPKQVAEYRAGSTKVLQYLVGQVMRISRGRVNPQLAIAELQRQLENR